MRSGIQLIRSSLLLFDRQARIRFRLIAVVFAMLALVDAFALVLVAVLTSVAVESQGGGTGTLPSQVRQFTEPLGLGTSSSVAALMAAVIVLMVGKSVLGALFTRWSLRFLASRDVALGDELLRHQLHVSWIAHLERDQGETVRDAVWSPTGVVQEYLGSALLSWAEVCTLAAIAGAVLLIEPLVAVVGGLYVAFLAVVLQRAVRHRTTVAGQKMFDSTAVVTKTVLQSLNTYKELLVRRRTNTYAERASRQRRDFTDAFAEMMFVGALSRYVLEGGLVVGVGLIALAAHLAGGSAFVATAIALFVTAGFRALPALHKLQVNIAMIRFRTPSVHAIRASANTDQDPDVAGQVDPFREPRLQGNLAIRGLTYSYPESDRAALDDVCIDIPLGFRVALVGPSGSGKTTLADAVLGLLPVRPNTITIDAVDIFDVCPQWRWSVGYVPQDIVMIDDSVAANVALGWTDHEIDRDLVWSALRRGQAEEFVRRLPEGLDTFLGERGLKLAGGQRQRIGIARALYTRPTFLVLDEATSSLDVETERSVMSAIEALQGEVTVLVVAHRLSTVRSADLVIYLEDGTVRAQGSFDDVVRTEPRFAQHAQLSGLV